MGKHLSDKEILSIFVSYLGVDLLVLEPVRRISPLNLDWLNGLYYGHEIIYTPETFVSATIRDCRLILKPLKTDEELSLKIGKLLYLGNSNDDFKIQTIKKQLGLLKFGGSCDYRIINILKDMYFAVPEHGVDLFKYGIAIKEEEAEEIIEKSCKIDIE